MKKKIIIAIGVWLSLLLILVVLYFNGLKPVSKSSQVKSFTVSTGTSKLDIVSDLKEAGLIKSKMSLYVYVLLNRNINLQAGTYELNTNMSAEEILEKISAGEINKDGVIYNLTFVEGKRITDYVKYIAKKTNYTEEEILAVMNDRDYLKELIDSYWFLTEDILDEKLYYPLEGYLFPDTYELYNDSSIKDIINRMLSGMTDKLTPLKSELEASKYSIHEILTMASVVENEEAVTEYRAGVAGVFYNRLNNNWPLGSDVTSYYGVKKDFSTALYQSELDDCNPYNTRGICAIKGLPLGPVSNPSLDSIKAALNPTNHDFYYFVADKNKKTYFTKTYDEHIAKTNELKAAGLWYEY
ncbi:MAG: endolytic transglycosylase MltG [Bacilli bacterium]|nr:endolytic transglycosylase MltG [Bacilli bacterium]